MDQRPNVKAVIVKLLKKNVGESLHDLGEQTKSLNHIMVHVLNLIKIKNCSLKGTIKKSKDKPRNGRKYSIHIYQITDIQNRQRIITIR